MNKGFATVYIVIILSSLMLLLLVVTEASSGFACAAAAENIALVSGRSLLSEYHPSLFKRYGIFMLRSNEIELEEMMKYYTGSNLSYESGLTRMSLDELSVSVQGYEGLADEAFKEQIERLSLVYGAEKLTEEGGLISIFSGLEELSETAGELKESEGSRLEELAGNAKEGEDGNEGSAAQLKELKHKYEEAMKLENQESSGASDKEIEPGLLNNLPSKLLGIPSQSLLSLSGGIKDLSPSAVLQAFYITQSCSNISNTYGNTYLNYECEYILFGKSGDEANEKALKRSLFLLRFPVRLGEIYMDDVRLGEISAIAAASFPMVPLPLSVFILASVEAATQAAEDVKTLVSGGNVPFVGEISQMGSYGDYLAILLLLLPEETRLSRLKDIMQLNAGVTDDTYFSFRDYCFGFTLRAAFKKQARVPDIMGIKERNYEIIRAFSYIQAQ